METKRVATVAVVVLLAGAVVAGAALAGVGPFGATTTPVQTSDDTGDSSPAAGASETDTGTDTTGTTSVPSGAGPFDFAVTNVTSCGTTCRDVDVALTNTAEERATNVSVTVVITTDGDEIWRDTQRIGTLAAGERTQRTAHVELSYFDAAKVKGNDGKITIHTTVDSSLGQHSFTQHRDVA
ncbi:hypothetical protein GCM10009037_16390 [Halarchaeum grantii]|uniref:Uncharacterized protein n=1 Tax=Halarchaeum grantii TaxID=1193105 RepID=A0A830FCK5_9EURY|nr:hypothetical protein [Halarchaeum grantii]GGL33482.1 hypothetical protein GCM10009037_16390 [Halarchaeum grantii]